MAVTGEISKIADIGKQKMIRGMALLSSNAMFAKNWLRKCTMCNKLNHMDKKGSKFFKR